MRVSCVVALLCSVVAEAEAEAPARRGLLYAARPIVRDGTEALLPRIQDQISRGITLAAPTTTQYAGFESYWSMRDRVSGFGVELVDLGAYAHHDYSPARQRMFEQLRRKNVSQVLRIEAYRPAPAKLSIRMDVFDLPVKTGEQWRHRQAKWIAPCGLPDEQVLDQLGDAARCLGSNECNRPPKAAIDVLPSPDIGVDQEVTLDGCASSDLDHDALIWTWQRFEPSQTPFAPVPSSVSTRACGPAQSSAATPGASSGTTETDSTTGRRWTMRFGRPGVYRVKLSVGQETGPGAAVAEVEIRVSKQPVADAGPDEKLEHRENRRVLLDGSKSRDADSCRWEQTSGPIGTFDALPFGSDGAMTCDAAACWFSAPGPGAYTFRLTVHNGPFSAQDDVVVLVDPKIRIHVVSARRTMFPLDSVRLSTVIDADDIDGEPAVRWEVQEREGTRRAWFSTPSERETRFTPYHPGMYRIRAIATGRKRAGDRELLVGGTGTIDLMVQNPSSFLYLETSASVPAFTHAANTKLSPTVSFLTRIRPERRMGVRTSLGLGAYDREDGPFLDLEGALDVAYAPLLHEKVQLYLLGGGWIAGRAEREADDRQTEWGPRLGLLGVLGPLGRSCVTASASIGLVFAEDQYLQFTFGLGIGTSVNTDSTAW